MKYYIWRETPYYRWYKDSNNGMHEIQSPYNSYALAKQEGTFVGEGNFCGYYSETRIENADVIAQAYSDCTSIEETEDSVNSTFSYYMEECENRDINDMYINPIEIELDNDKEAINYFYEYCEAHKEDT